MYIVFYEITDLLNDSLDHYERRLCIEEISVRDLKLRAQADGTEVYIVGTYPTLTRARDKYNTLIELQNERIAERSPTPRQSPVKKARKRTFKVDSPPTPPKPKVGRLFDPTLLEGV